MDKNKIDDFNIHSFDNIENHETIEQTNSKDLNNSKIYDVYYLDSINIILDQIKNGLYEEAQNNYKKYAKKKNIIDFLIVEKLLKYKTSSIKDLFYIHFDEMLFKKIIHDYENIFTISFQNDILKALKDNIKTSYPSSSYKIMNIILNSNNAFNKSLVDIYVKDFIDKLNGDKGNNNDKFAAIDLYFKLVEIDNDKCYELINKLNEFGLYECSKHIFNKYDHLLNNNYEKYLLKFLVSTNYRIYDTFIDNICNEKYVNDFKELLNKCDNKNKYKLLEILFNRITSDINNFDNVYKLKYLFAINHECYISYNKQLIDKLLIDQNIDNRSLKFLINIFDKKDSEYESYILKIFEVSADKKQFELSAYCGKLLYDLDLTYENLDRKLISTLLFDLHSYHSKNSKTIKYNFNEYNILFKSKDNKYIYKYLNLINALIDDTNYQQLLKLLEYLLKYKNIIDPHIYFNTIKKVAYKLLEYKKFNKAHKYFKLLTKIQSNSDYYWSLLMCAYKCSNTDELINKNKLISSSKYYDKALFSAYNTDKSKYNQFNNVLKMQKERITSQKRKIMNYLSYRWELLLLTIIFLILIITWIIKGNKMFYFGTIYIILFALSIILAAISSIKFFKKEGLNDNIDIEDQVETWVGGLIIGLFFAGILVFVISILSNNYNTVLIVFLTSVGLIALIFIVLLTINGFYQLPMSVALITQLICGCIQENEIDFDRKISNNYIYYEYSDNYVIRDYYARDAKKIIFPNDINGNTEYIINLTFALDLPSLEYVIIPESIKEITYYIYDNDYNKYRNKFDIYLLCSNNSNKNYSFYINSDHIYYYSDVTVTSGNYWHYDSNNNPVKW